MNRNDVIIMFTDPENKNDLLSASFILTMEIILSISSSTSKEANPEHMLPTRTKFDSIPNLSVSDTFLAAPVNGLYSFTVFFIMDTAHTDLGVKVNNVDACIAFAQADHYGNAGKCTAIVELAAGDLVNVKIINGGSTDGGYVHGGKYSGLSGFLLKRFW